MAMASIPKKEYAVQGVLDSASIGRVYGCVPATRPRRGSAPARAPRSVASRSVHGWSWARRCSASMGAPMPIAGSRLVPLALSRQAPELDVFQSLRLPVPLHVSTNWPNELDPDDDGQAHGDQDDCDGANHCAALRQVEAKAWTDAGRTPGASSAARSGRSRARAGTGTSRRRSRAGDPETWAAKPIRSRGPDGASSPCRQPTPGRRAAGTPT